MPLCSSHWREGGHFTHGFDLECPSCRHFFRSFSSSSFSLLSSLSYFTLSVILFIDLPCFSLPMDWQLCNFFKVFLLLSFLLCTYKWSRASLNIASIPSTPARCRSSSFVLCLSTRCSSDHPHLSSHEKELFWSHQGPRIHPVHKNELIQKGSNQINM